MSDEIITPEEKSPRRFNWAKIGIFFSTLGIVIIILALGYGYFGLARVNIRLSEMISDLQTQSTNNKNEIMTMQKTLGDLQQSAQKSQELVAQQEQLMTQLRSAQKGDFEKWHAAEAQYLVKLANDNLQFTHDTVAALMLLQRADQVLQDIQDPNLLEIRKSIAADIANLQTLPTSDITQLYLRLTTINAQLEHLPLHFSPLKAEPKETAPEASTGLSWWRSGLNRSWEALRQIVVVRNTGPNATPLVFPEEKVFLYQNLHAQMESAIWGLLHRNVQIYQTSLSRVSTWIQQYFDQNEQSTKDVLQSLEELQKIDIQAPAANLSNTLQLFTNYFAQSGAVQPTQ